MTSAPGALSRCCSHFLVLLVVTGLFAASFRIHRLVDVSTGWCNRDYVKEDCFNEAGQAAASNTSTGLKVIMPSVGQTGTTSLILALRELGYRAYHADDYSVMGKSMMFDHVSPSLYSRTVSRCRMDAISLEPVTDKLPMVLATSPDAKFVLTWRSFPSWRRSTVKFQTRDKPFGGSFRFVSMAAHVVPWVDVFDYLTGYIRQVRREGAAFHESDRPRAAFMYRMLCNGYSWAINDVTNRGTYKVAAHEEAYLAHINEILTTVPRDRLLVHDVTRHGWQELERFLGLPPKHSGRPFPRPRTAQMRTNEPLIEKHPSIALPVLLTLTSLFGLNWLLILLPFALIPWLAGGCRPPRLEDAHARWSEALRRSPVVAVDGLSASQALPVGKALAKAGVRIIAVSLRGPEAMASIRLLAEALPFEVLVGAVAVGSACQAKAVQRAGGAFVLSSSVDARVVGEAQALGLVCVAGAYTPSDAATAHSLGVDGIAVCPGEPATPERTVALCAALPPGAPLFVLPPGRPQKALLADLRAAGASAFGATISVEKSSDAAAAAAAAARDFLAACDAF